MSKETALVPHALSHIDVASLAPVTLEELTTTVIAGLNIIAAIIPDLRVPHPATKKKVRGARTVPREAVISIIAMVESSLVLQGMEILNLARAREVVEHDHGYRVLDERMEMLRKQVRYTMEARWAEVTSEAMDAYQVAKRLARDPRCAELAAHLDTIRRHLGRTNKKKTKSPDPA